MRAPVAAPAGGGQARDADFQRRRRFGADARRLDQPLYFGRGEPVVYRADGRLGGAAVRRAQQPAGAALVDRRRQCAGGDGGCLRRSADPRSGPGLRRCGGGGHRPDVQAALPASPGWRGGADRHPRRPRHSPDGLPLRAVPGAAELGAAGGAGHSVQ